MGISNSRILSRLDLFSSRSFLVSIFSGLDLLSIFSCFDLQVTETQSEWGAT